MYLNLQSNLIMCHALNDSSVNSITKGWCIRQRDAIYYSCCYSITILSHSKNIQESPRAENIYSIRLLTPQDCSTCKRGSHSFHLLCSCEISFTTDCAGGMAPLPELHSLWAPGLGWAGRSEIYIYIYYNILSKN